MNSWEHLTERFDSTRRCTQQLCAELSDEDCALQSMPDASPAKWHLAHTSWFFETFVLPALPALPRRSIRSTRTCSTRTTTQSATRHRAAERGLLSRPIAREVLRLPRARRRARCAALLAIAQQRAATARR